jgi:hypothetical protein
LARAKASVAIEHLLDREGFRSADTPRPEARVTSRQVVYDAERVILA